MNLYSIFLYQTSNVLNTLIMRQKCLQQLSVTVSRTIWIPLVFSKFKKQKISKHCRARSNPTPVPFFKSSQNVSNVSVHHTQVSEKSCSQKTNISEFITSLAEIITSVAFHSILLSHAKAVTLYRSTSFNTSYLASVICYSSTSV